jgi:hypothetical protein
MLRQQRIIIIIKKRRKNDVYYISREIDGFSGCAGLAL